MYQLSQPGDLRREAGDGSPVPVALGKAGFGGGTKGGDTVGESVESGVFRIAVEIDTAEAVLSAVGNDLFRRREGHVPEPRGNAPGELEGAFTGGLGFSCTVSGTGGGGTHDQLSATDPSEAYSLPWSAGLSST